MKNKIEKFEQPMEVKLTDLEKLELNAEMVEKMSEKKERERDFDGVKKEHKKKVHLLESDIDGIYRRLKDKNKIEDVECERLFNYETGEIDHVRLDTGVVFHTREMTNEERQVEI